MVDENVPQEPTHTQNDRDLAESRRNEDVSRLMRWVATTGLEADDQFEVMRVLLDYGLAMDRREGRWRLTITRDRLREDLVDLRVLAVMELQGWRNETDVVRCDCGTSLMVFDVPVTEIEDV